jgi:hypothetical protein
VAEADKGARHCDTDSYSALGEVVMPFPNEESGVQGSELKNWLSPGRDKSLT